MRPVVKQDWQVVCGRHNELADMCSQFLYKTYVLQEKWIPHESNPINLTITKESFPRLIDDYTYKTTWIALKRKGEIVGVARYYCDADGYGYEMEKYTALPQLITKRRNNTAEMNRFSITKEHMKGPALIIIEANIYKKFEIDGVRYSFGSGQQWDLLNLYVKLGLNDITVMNDRTRNYLLSNSYEIDELEEFNYGDDDSKYHVLWAENLIHRKKLFNLYSKIENKNNIHVEYI